MGEAVLGVVHLTVFAEVHVGVGEGRCDLAEVDGDRPVLICEVHDHEAAAAQVACARECYRQCEPDADRCIDGIAASLEDFDPDPCGYSVLAGDHAIPTHDRVVNGIVGDDRSRRLGRGDLAERR